MQPDERDASPVTDHGGNLAAARARFPEAAEPWIDLSTGISPFPYPYSPPTATAFCRLPERADISALEALAAEAYEAPSAANVVAAPGTQMLLPFVYGLRDKGSVVVLGPTYSEHNRVAALLGHECREASKLDALAHGDIGVVVNPNNPDGRMTPRSELIELAARMTKWNWFLVADEAFMDVGPIAQSLAPFVEELPIVVLRSFGKFHGLGGLRLGFAIASEKTAEALRARMGPWAISGPAVEIGREALADAEWRQQARSRLSIDAYRLDDLLIAHGMEIAGGTSLFRLARHEDASWLFQLLGQQGILVRAFTSRPRSLRFGLPADEEAWGRLEAALSLWSRTREG